MSEYMAFLRGINVGKQRRVKMENLRAAFEDMGYENVRTILASGNVIFESSSMSAPLLENKIAKTLAAIIGFECDIFVIDVDSLRELAHADPFREYRKKSQFRLYVTFTRGKPNAGLKFPARGDGYTILGKFGGILCSVVDVSHGSASDLMRELDKAWRVNTTRGWNTIERILK